MTDLTANPERLASLVGVVLLLLTFITLILRGVIVPRYQVVEVKEALARATSLAERQAAVIATLNTSVERLSQAVDRCTCHGRPHGRERA